MISIPGTKSKIYISGKVLYGKDSELVNFCKQNGKILTAGELLRAIQTIINERNDKNSRHLFDDGINGENELLSRNHIKMMMMAENTKLEWSDQKVLPLSATKGQQWRKWLSFAIFVAAEISLFTRGKWRWTSHISTWWVEIGCRQDRIPDPLE